MFLIRIAIIIGIAYFIWKKFSYHAASSDHDNVLRYVNGDSLDLNSLYDSIEKLGPGHDYAMNYCGLTEKDIVDQYKQTAWKPWPEGANVIFHKGSGSISDKILYERCFFTKDSLVVFHQILDCRADTRHDSVLKISYDNLLVDDAEVRAHQYMSRKSNWHPDIKSIKPKPSIEDFYWLEIPTVSGVFSERVRLLSFGDKEDGVVLGTLKDLIKENQN